MILSDTVDKFNLTTIVEPDYFPIVGKGYPAFGLSAEMDVSHLGTNQAKNFLIKL